MRRGKLSNGMDKPYSGLAANEKSVAPKSESDPAIEESHTQILSSPHVALTREETRFSQNHTHKGVCAPQIRTANLKALMSFTKLRTCNKNKNRGDRNGKPTNKTTPDRKTPDQERSKIRRKRRNRPMGTHRQQILAERVRNNRRHKIPRKPRGERSSMTTPTTRKLALVCPYANTPECNDNCLKCVHLLRTQIINLNAKEPTETSTCYEGSCACS